MNGNLVTKTTLPKGENVIFNDNCGSGNSCTYRIVTSSAGIGPNPNVATVNC
jgi:hypothetical protein